MILSHEPAGGHLPHRLGRRNNLSRLEPYILRIHSASLPQSTRERYRVFHGTQGELAQLFLRAVVKYQISAPGSMRGCVPPTAQSYGAERSSRRVLATSVDTIANDSATKTDSWTRHNSAGTLTTTVPLTNADHLQLVCSYLVDAPHNGTHASNRHASLSHAAILRTTSVPALHYGGTSIWL